MIHKGLSLRLGRTRDKGQSAVARMLVSKDEAEGGMATDQL